MNVIRAFWESLKGNTTPEMISAARWATGGTILLIVILLI